MPELECILSVHENIRQERETAGGSDRNFGLIVGGALAAIGFLRVYLHWSEGLSWLSLALVGVGLLLMVLGVVAPAALSGLNRLWTKLGLILAKVVNPIVLGLIFFVTIVPTGLIMRLTGGNSLKRKFDPEASSYWINRDPPGPEPDSMKNQF